MPPGGLKSVWKDPGLGVWSCGRQKSRVALSQWELALARRAETHLMQAPPLSSFFLETRQRVPSLATSALDLTLPQLPPFFQNPFS